MFIESYTGNDVIVASRIDMTYIGCDIALIN